MGNGPRLIQDGSQDESPVLNQTRWQDGSQIVPLAREDPLGRRTGLYNLFILIIDSRPPYIRTQVPS
jgi:hypothetical protein